MAEENIVVKIKADIGITKEVIETITKALEGMGKTATIVSGNVKVTNKNLEDTNKILGQVAQTAGKTTGAIGGAGDAVKKSNQQWTNLALVIQDLPYGFRGIQNNLPALIGGFAGVTGGIYFATSAIIAFFTAYDNGAFGSTKTNEDWKKSIKETNDELKNSVNYTTAEISNLQGLIAVMTDVNSTEGQRKKALQEVKEAITKVDEAEGKKITGLYSAITAVNLYTEAIQQQQMQEVIGKRIAEISLEQISKRNNLAIETRKAERGIHPIDAFMGNQELTNLQAGIIANETLLRQLEDLRVGNTKALLSNPFSKFNAKGQTSAQGDAEAKKAAELRIKANEAETKAYLNSLDERSKKEFQAGLDLQSGLESMKVAGFSNSETYYASYRANMDKIAKEYDDKEYKRNQDSINANIAAETKFYNDSERAWDDIQKKKADGQAKYTKEYVSSMELQLKTELKLHRNSVTLMEEDIKNKIKQLEVARIFAFGNQQSLAIIDKAINGLKAQLTGLGNVATAVQGILNSTITQGFEALGETIGNLVLTGKLDFSSLGNILADALIQIGKALIMYSALVKAAKDALEKGQFKAGLVIGVLAIAAGVALKGSLNKKKDTASPKAFADGGIISGPTMGLMGEYPGAKSNPEVVAPLDKLKGLIGGGTLTTKISGNDLYIIMNKASQNRNTIF